MLKKAFAGTSQVCVYIYRFRQWDTWIGGLIYEEKSITLDIASINNYITSI